MKRSNEVMMEILAALRRLPKWALVLLTLGIIICLGIALFFLVPQTSLSQENGVSPSSTGLAFSVFLKLGIVVVIIIGLAIVVKKWQGKIQTVTSNKIKIVETVHLSPHQSLYLIEFQGRELLLGGTDQSISTLSILDTDERNKSKDSTFSDILSSVN